MCFASCNISVFGVFIAKSVFTAVNLFTAKSVYGHVFFSIYRISMCLLLVVDDSLCLRSLSELYQTFSEYKCVQALIHSSST